MFFLNSKQTLDLYEIFKTSSNVNSRCIVKTDKMSIKWKARGDITLPHSQSHHIELQNQTWSDYQQIPTAQQNTQYVKILIHLILYFLIQVYDASSSEVWWRILFIRKIKITIYLLWIRTKWYQEMFTDMAKSS